MPYLPWQQNVKKIHRARPRSLRGYQLTSITNDFLGMWVDDVTSLSELSTICREKSKTNESRNLILYILKMRFFSYDYEIFFSSWSITQGTIIRKKIIFFWQLAYVLICLNLYTTIHYKFTCVYKKYPSLPVLWHVIDELEMMEGVSDSLHDLFWHVIHPLDVRMSDPAITWRTIMSDNK